MSISSVLRFKFVFIMERNTAQNSVMTCVFFISSLVLVLRIRPKKGDLESEHKMSHIVDGI